MGPAEAEDLRRAENAYGKYEVPAGCRDAADHMRQLMVQPVDRIRKMQLLNAALAEAREAGRREVTQAWHEGRR